MFMPHTLTTEYRGRQTFSSLSDHLSNLTYLALNDAMLEIDLVGVFKSTIYYPIDLRPTVEDSHLVFKCTQQILSELASKESRGLNVPEVLSLSKEQPGVDLVALGQRVLTPFGAYAFCLIGGGGYLLPFDRPWGDRLTVPTTAAPNPLVQ